MSADFVPIGAVLATGLTRAPNDNYLACEGQTLSADTYAELYAAIGNLYGGDPAKREFRLPDYRGLFLRGAAQGSAADPEGDRRVPQGTGAAQGAGSLQDWATGRPAVPFTGVVSYLPSSVVGAHGITKKGRARVNGGKTIDTCTGGGDGETRPINVYVQYFIKVRD